MTAPLTASHNALAATVPADAVDLAAEIDALSQARVHGELDRETARYLDRIAKDRARRRRAGEGKPKAPPPIPPAPATRSLKPGTLLAREYDGHLHRVTVVPDGFAWNGAVYNSLSEIARAITGTRWNGPRFFGLRDRPARTDAQESRA